MFDNHIQNICFAQMKRKKWRSGKGVMRVDGREEGQRRGGDEGTSQKEQTEGPNCKKIIVIIRRNEKYLVPPQLLFCLSSLLQKQVTGRDRHDLHHVRVHSSTDELSDRGHVTRAEGQSSGGADGDSAPGCCAFGRWKSPLHTRLSE